MYNEELFIADLSDIDAIRNIIENNQFDAVMNFAASIEVAESVADPIKYYSNNTRNTLNLLTVMKENSLNKLIFSSLLYMEMLT